MMQLMILLMDSLPMGWYGVGDAAYTLSEHLLTPFTGVGRLDPAHDAFNYYLSQLRIRVEMAFGRLVNMFRILNDTIVGSMERVSAILTACTRLHNFIIREDKPFTKTFATADDEFESFDLPPFNNAPFDMSYLPIVPDADFEIYDEVTYTRDGIVHAIREQDISRPSYNIERRKNELRAIQLATGEIVDREFISPI